MTNVNQLITEHIDIWTSATEKKSSAGRGNSGKIGLHGIKKLRELILELAVRGKLLTQEESEGTAQRLLNEVGGIRHELIAKKFIRKTKSAGAVKSDEMRFEIPKNWAWTRLVELAEIAPKNEADKGDLVSFVPMTEIWASHTGAHGQEERSWGEIKKGYTHFADGDVALAKITPCFENSKAAVFSSLKNGIGAGTTELHVARLFSDKVVGRFILLHFKTPSFLVNGMPVMTGSAGQKRIPRWYFADTPIALPPTAEQHRIVAKVDELMGLCDALEAQTVDSLKAHQTLVETCLATLTNSQSPEDFAQNWSRIEEHFNTLFTTEESFEQLQKVLLNLAVNGMLGTQNKGDEPAQRAIEVCKVAIAKMVQDGQIRKPKELQKIDDSKRTRRLPIGWARIRFGKLITLISGQHLKPSEYSQSGTYPYLTGPAEFGPKHPVCTRFTEETRSIVSAGDILVTCKGSGIGKTNLADQDIAISRQLMAVRAIGLDSKFAMLFVNNLKDHLRTKMVGIAIPGISREDILEAEIQLPPIQEQRRIVAKLESINDLCDMLITKIPERNNKNRQLVDTLVTRIH